MGSPSVVWLAMLWPKVVKGSYCMSKLYLLSCFSLLFEQFDVRRPSLPDHPQCSPSRKDREKDDPRSHHKILYIQGVLEAVTRTLILSLHEAFRTLRRILSHPKLMVISSMLCIRSTEKERALKTHLSEHCRAIEKMDFSSSALAQHAW